MPAGRKPRDRSHDEEKKAKFLEVLIDDDCRGFIQQALSKLKIPWNWYVEWRKDPEFVEAIERAQEKTVRWVESKLMERMQAGSDSSIQFYLKTKGKSYGYQETTKQEVDLNSNVDIEAALEKMAAQVSGAE